LEHGDSESVGDIVAGLFMPFAKGVSLKSVIAVLFQHQMLSRESIESHFAECISVREAEFGKDHPRTTETRLGFVYALLEILEADGEGPGWDQEFARRLLERCRDMLCGMLGPYFSKETVDVLLRPVDAEVAGELSLWETYEFLESATLACIQNNFLIHAILGCMDYERLRSVYVVKKTIRELIQMGLLAEHKVSTIALLSPKMRILRYPLGRKGKFGEKANSGRGSLPKRRNGRTLSFQCQRKLMSR
jgi:hypothetical protein